MDLDLRKLRYFVAVAEHSNFGRAAEALHIAQPVLSRQIRALETELKVQLFDRSSKGTALTPAGSQLLADARPLLAQASALLRRVGVADAFTVGYVRLPVPMDGLRRVPLFTEPRVAVVAATHRLAGKESVLESDLSGERRVQHTDTPGIRTVEEKLEHVAMHGGVAILPLSTAVFYSREDLVHVPIEDIEPNEVALAWAAHRHTPLIEEFTEIVTATAQQG